MGHCARFPTIPLMGATVLGDWRHFKKSMASQVYVVILRISLANILPRRANMKSLVWAVGPVRIKPWPNGLTFSACIKLAFRLPTHLRWLWLSSNSYTSRRKFFTVWPPNASRTSWSQVNCQLYMSKIYNLLRLVWTCEPTCESIWPPIESPYLRRLASWFSRWHIMSKHITMPSSTSFA